jgi:hypothetical protein
VGEIVDELDLGTDQETVEERIVRKKETAVQCRRSTDRLAMLYECFENRLNTNIVIMGDENRDPPSKHAHNQCSFTGPSR